MKTRYITHIITAVCLSSSLGLGGCIEEVFPENGSASIDQIGKSDEALDAMLNSVVAFVHKYNSYGSHANHDFGYSGYNLLRDAACEDFLCPNPREDRFSAFAKCTSLGANSGAVNTTGYYCYKFINAANNTLNALKTTEEVEKKKHYEGICLAYRAMIYMDLARMYEYKKTGVPKLDNDAEKKGIKGLTMPIVTEDTGEAEGRNNPRAPFYEMYKFILDDLAKAEEDLADYTRPTKNMPCTAVVHGLMARMWLEMGSRFNRYPEDLQTLNSNTDLNIASAEACFAKAAQYARSAIAESGATPLTETQWFGGDNYNDGFNNIATPSWMWGGILTSEQVGVAGQWICFTGNVCPEQFFGVCNSYEAFKAISKKLFDLIPDEDWRKTTWVAPEDAGKAPGTKYRTILTDEEFADIPEYTGIKFRCKDGEQRDYNIGAATDYPLMRVEEMYLIEAEAIGMSQGLAAGKQALEDFVTTYRYKPGSPRYVSTATTLREFQEEVVRQKRIEFWGEGVVFWDYKRLELRIERGYPGTNAPKGYRFNSNEGYCAPWLNVYISTYEELYNEAIIINPDPSLAIPEWSETE